VPKEGQTSLFQYEAQEYFYTFMETCIMNSFPRVKLWTNILIQIFCSMYGKMCSKNNPKSDALEIGFSTMTMLPLSSLYTNFSPIMAQLLFHTPLTPQTWHHVTIFSKTQVGTEGKIWLHHDSQTIAGYTFQVQNKGLLQMFSTMV
jgi:hypothetical protein